jgi:hypothetical protein
MKTFKSLFLATLLLSSTMTPVMAQSFGTGSSSVSALTGSGNPSTGDCDPAVYQMQSNLVKQLVDDRTAYAYGNYSTLPAGQGFGTLSCIENLFNGSLDIIFNPPSLAQLLNMLINVACNKLMTQITQIESMSGIGKALGGSLPIGQIIPGVNMGSLNGGIQVINGNGPGVLPTLMGQGGNGSMVTTNLAAQWQNQQYQMNNSMNQAGAMFGSVGSLAGVSGGSSNSLGSSSNSTSSLCSTLPGMPGC